MLPMHTVQEMTEEVTGLIFYAEKEQLVVVGASCRSVDWKGD